jgi:kinesin family protein 15
METTLAGSLRREQMAEISIKQLDAEIEQLNRLVWSFFFFFSFF